LLSSAARRQVFQCFRQGFLYLRTLRVLHNPLDDLEQSYNGVDREREEVIRAYNGSAEVLEDDDYKSATQRRSQISAELSKINNEREMRR
jgi:hypothetical protein